MLASLSMANLVGERWARLSVQQKISAVILGMCGGMTLILSIAQLRTQILSPFFVQRRVLDRSQAFFAKQEEEAQKIELLKKKDTDGDGLSDYDELYVYHTSPYLADTDGDTIPDGEEVARGIDPNCPEGKTCIDPQALVGTTNVSSTLAGLGVSAPATTITASSTIGGSSAAGVRAFLTDQNVLPKEQLDQIPDDLLLQIYGGVYAEQQRLERQNTATTTSPSSRSSNP